MARPRKQTYQNLYDARMRAAGVPSRERVSRAIEAGLREAISMEMRNAKLADRWLPTVYEAALFDLKKDDRLDARAAEKKLRIALGLKVDNAVK